MDDEDGYGGYGGYFQHNEVYYDQKYGKGGANNLGQVYGPNGKNISESSENALLPNDVPTHYALLKIYEEKWNKWVEDYYKNKVLQNEQQGILTSEERREQSDPSWPLALIGFGKGNDGDPPPPYAYVPSNDEEYPSLCYKPIHKGRYLGIKCNPGPRYAFQAGVKICVAFYFRGCGGNQNNFKTKQGCEDTCTKTPMSGCNPNTMQEMGHGINDLGLL